MSPWTRVGLVGAIFAAGVITTLGLRGDDTSAVPEETAPSRMSAGNLTGVITIMLDDLDDVPCRDIEQYFPKSGRYFADQGTCYENASVASPVCCPSRAAYMTGQYPHNNTVRTLQDGQKFHVQDSIQYNLRANGVETHGDGKFLNGVSMEMLASDEYDTGFSVQHLWDQVRYLEYRLINEQGEIYTPNPQLHATVQQGEFMLDYVAGALEEGRLFYSYEAFMAPHEQHPTASAKLRLPRATKANAHAPVPLFKYDPEPNTDDKLKAFQKDPKRRGFYKTWHASRIRTVYDVDDQLAKLFSLLESQGVLDTTAVFLTSDNGYHLGRNNWQHKGLPYPASLNVPLLAHLPGTFAAGKVVRRHVNLLDLAPTIYELYGVTPTNTLDGHSLLGDHRRQDEYWELAKAPKSGKKDRVPSWSSYSRQGRTYVEFYGRNGKRVVAREFYADKGAERNLLYKDFADQRPTQRVIRQFRQALRKYQTCAGTVESGATNPCP